MIGIIDYGMGNLRSVEKGFAAVDQPCRILNTAQGIEGADRLVLPGVGAFGRAMENLQAAGLLDPLRKAISDGKPLLGICLGLQLLFDASDEHGHHAGLGLLAGAVRRFPDRLRVPHIGWNQLHLVTESPLLAGVSEGAYVYFVQSYYAETQDAGAVLATTDYGPTTFAAAVGQENVFAVQFHPEKSQEVGLRILENFGEMRC